MQRLSLLLALFIIGSCSPDSHSETSPQRKAWQTTIDTGDADQMNRRWVVAEFNFKNALSVAEKFGPDSQEVQVTLPRLAACLVLQNKFDEAEPLYKRSVGLVYRLRSENPPVQPDPDSLVWLDDLSDAYQDKAKAAKQDYCLEHCTSIRRAIAPGHHNKLAPTLHDLGALYMQKGEWGRAESCYKEELAIVTNKYGANDKHNIGALCALAQAQKWLKKYAQARANLEHALVIMKTEPRTEQCYISATEKWLQDIVQMEGATKAGR